jgi:hypothetical protein
MNITNEQKTKIIELTDKLQMDLLYFIENSDAADNPRATYSKARTKFGV